MSVDKDTKPSGSLFAKVEANDQFVADAVEKQAKELIKRGREKNDPIAMDSGADALATANALRKGITVAPKVVQSAHKSGITIIIRET
jgi:hypothetical protein